MTSRGSTRSLHGHTEPSTQACVEKLGQPVGLAVPPFRDQVHADLGLAWFHSGRLSAVRRAVYSPSSILSARSVLAVLPLRYEYQRSSAAHACGSVHVRAASGKEGELRVKVGVARERREGERRVAATPEAVGSVQSSGN